MGVWMKKTYMVGLLGACFAIILFCSAPALAADDIRFYVEAEMGASYLDFDSGGHNSGGGIFHNIDDSSEDALITGIHFGAKLTDDFRADIGFNHRSDLDFTTNSYPSTPQFYFYKTDIEDIYTLMFSLYYEPIDFKKFTPYVGLGAGGTWAKVSTNDGAVSGSSDKVNFAWQAEAGIQYDLTERFTLKLGYRYIDMGNVKVHLRGIVDGEAYGKYRGELTANEVVFGVRYNF